MQLDGVELHPEAADELGQAVDWYEEERPGRGVRFLGVVREGLARISVLPRSFPPWSPARDDIRRAALPRFPYVLPFVIRERPIVLAIAHTRRRPGYWLRRLEP